MRKLILKMNMSLDGFVCGPNREGEGLFFGGDAQSRDWTVETIWNASLHIMGRKTFRDMSSHWPTSTEVFAPPMNQIPKAVFTRGGASSLAAPAAAGELQPGAESWSSAYVASGDLAEEIARLKAEDGKPIVAHGGAGFAQSLVAAGVIDEYHLLTRPVALGQGLSPFADLSSPRRLELIDLKRFPAGAIAQIYRHA